MIQYLTAGEYLPHDTPMILLEDVISVTDDDAHCRVSVNKGACCRPLWMRKAICPVGMRWS